jgi:dTDP-4-dehydrorhamnose 3,5-epimerase
METYHAERYRDSGVTTHFVQDNYSRSSRGTLRGLHLQVNRPQAKLVRVVHGTVFDVAVDVRVGSPTFGQWTAATLSAENCRQLFIPEGFAHGFAVLSDYADVEYKCSAFYSPQGEITIRHNEPAFDIAWPLTAPTLSQRDAAAPSLAEVRERLPRYAEP